MSAFVAFLSTLPLPAGVRRTSYFREVDGWSIAVDGASVQLARGPHSFSVYGAPYVYGSEVNPSTDSKPSDGKEQNEVVATTAGAEAPTGEAEQADTRADRGNRKRRRGGPIR